MKNGAIVCKCGHCASSHAKGKHQCVAATATRKDSLHQPKPVVCNCLRYRPCRVKVVWVDLEGATKDGSCGYWYTDKNGLSLKRHRVEVLVPIKGDK